MQAPAVPKVPGLAQGVWTISRPPPAEPLSELPARWSRPRARRRSKANWAAAAESYPSVTQEWTAETIDNCRRPIVLLLALAFERRN